MGEPYTGAATTPVGAAAETSASHRGLFIVLEGGDHTGKTTQFDLLTAWLAREGIDHVGTREPGGTWLGGRLRELVLDPGSGDISPRAEALLYAADKAQHVSEVVRPALERGAVVVSDRYVDSMIAYQGGGRELPVDAVERLARWATGGLLPDLTVLLDLSPERGVATIGRKDRIESAGHLLHVRAREAFLALADRDPGRYLVLPARAGTPEQTAALIRERVLRLDHPWPPRCRSGMAE